MKKIFYLFLFVMLLSACSSGSNISLPELSDRPWLSGDDFHSNPNLHAQDFQTLIIRVDDALAPSAPGNPAVQTVHTVPYYFKYPTNLTLKLDTHAPCIQKVSLHHDANGVALHADLNNPTASAAVYPGRYTMTIEEVYPLPDHCSSSFIYKMAQDADVAEAMGAASFDSGEGVFRAFRALKWIDTYKRMEFLSDQGYLLSLKDTVPSQPLSLPNRYITYLTSDITFLGKSLYPTTPGQPVAPLRIGNDEHLLAFVPFAAEKQRYKIYSKKKGPGFLYQTALIAYSPGTRANWHYGAATACWAQEVAHGYAVGDMTAQMAFHGNSIYTTHYWDQYYTHDRFKDRWSGIVYSKDDVPGFTPYEFDIVWNTGKFGAHSVAFRGQNGAAGDNLILSGVFFKSGVCWGLDEGNYNYTLSLNEVYRYYETASSLKKLGDDDVALYSGVNFTGNVAVFNTHSTLPFVDFSGFPVRSIRVGHAATLKLFDDRDYQGNVVTVGIDIPDISTDPRFSGFGATRSLTVFRAAEIIISNDCPGCNLQDVNLSGHKFDNRNFTRTNFTRANLTGASLMNTRLYAAVLQNARLDNANLKGANLCRALLNKDPHLQKAATLNGAYLQNTNLAFAEMSGASFVNASFHSMTSKDSCIPDVECKTTACASAHKATMSNTDFTGAYLNGTDMSNATMTATKFTNAFAVGVNFSNSNLSSDPTTGQSGAVFIGTYLFGANFNNAKVQGVQFSNAYFDDQVSPPAAKGVAIMHLNSFYTSFPGSPFNASYVCPQYVAPLVTSAGYLPTTDNSVTCPNLQPGPCSGAQWTAAIPWNNSYFTITYGKQSHWPAPSLCAPDRVYLFW